MLLSNTKSPWKFVNFWTIAENVKMKRFLDIWLKSHRMNGNEMKLKWNKTLAHTHTQLETTNMDLSADGICVLWIWIVNEILYWTQKEITSSNLARKTNEWPWKILSIVEFCRWDLGFSMRFGVFGFGQIFEWLTKTI